MLVIFFTKPLQPFANCEKLTTSSMQVIPDKYLEKNGSQQHGINF